MILLHILTISWNLGANAELFYDVINQHRKCSLHILCLELFADLLVSGSSCFCFEGDVAAPCAEIRSLLPMFTHQLRMDNDSGELDNVPEMNCKRKRGGSRKG